MASIKSSVIFIVATLITVVFKQLFICTAAYGLNIAGNEASSFQDKYVSGACGAIVLMQYEWVHHQ